MSNYTSQNLINVPSSKVPAGTLAMKVGQNIFTAGHVIIQISSSGTQDLDAYVVQSNSGVLYARKLKFNGTEASDSQTVELLSDSSVLIFNTGHPEPQGGGSSPVASMDFYKCTYVNSDSWGGKKAVLNDGAYSFESDSTEGLSYTSLIPVVDGIYSQDALIKAAIIFSHDSPAADQYTKFLMFGSVADSTNTVQIQNHGLTVDSQSWIVCNQSSWATIPAGELPQSVLASGMDWTLQIKFKCQNVSWIPSVKCCLFGYGDGQNRFDIIIGATGGAIGGVGDFSYSNLGIEQHLFKVVHYNDNSIKAYMDQTSILSATYNKNPRLNALDIGRDGLNNSRLGYPFKFHWIRISNTIR